MKRYAVKVIKGKEYLQSKNDCIDLGSKSLEVHNKVIDILNKGNFLKNLNNDIYYFLVNENDLCFNAYDYCDYKLIYGKYKLSLRRI